MKDVLVSIPVYNQGNHVLTQIEWFLFRFPNITITIWDDGSTEQKYIKNIPPTVFVQKVARNMKLLKYFIEQSADMAHIMTMKYVLVCEHDIIPDRMAFLAMHEVLENSGDDICCCSCFYKWDGKMCYPSRWQWSKDPSRLISNQEVFEVQDDGVPFGFSLWKTSDLLQLKEIEYHKVVGLDSAFGKYMKEQGKKFLRVPGDVEHLNGGVKSWKRSR